MDKSAAYENFMNKMVAMQGQGKPKMSATSMKIGGVGLEKRVTNNERKITLLKNIFKAQKVKVDDKITPQVNNLELSLRETANILKIIGDKLQLDLSNRLADQKALLDAQRQNNLNDQRDQKENQLETKKKTTKIGSSIKKNVIKPFGNIFDKLLELAGILGTGLLATNILKKLDDNDFVQRLNDIFTWTTENWKALAIGAGILGTILLGGAIASVIAGVGTVFAVLTNPVVLVALGILGLYAIGKFLDRKFDESLSEAVDVDNTNRFRGSELPGAPTDAQVGDYFTGANGLIYEKVPYDNSLGGWRIVDEPFNEETFKNEIAKTYGGTNPRLDGTVIPRDLTSVYKENIAARQSGTSILPFVTDMNELRSLVKEFNPKTIFENLPDIDLTSDARNEIGEVSNNPATGVPDISSINMSNPYMEEVPSLLGFADIIYS